MITNKLKFINYGLLAGFAITLISVIGYNNVNADLTGFLRNASYRYAHGWSDDQCYATSGAATNALNNIAGSDGDALNLVNRLDPSKAAGDEQRFGLVNTIVRIPIYDWDQELAPVKSLPSNGTIERRPDPFNGFKYNTALPVGYVKAFTFNVTPIPSATWLKALASSGTEYLANDLMGFGLAKIDGSDRNRIINASPLIYSQMSLIDSQGFPRAPLLRGRSESGGITGGNSVFGSVLPGGKISSAESSQNKMLDNIGKGSPIERAKKKIHEDDTAKKILSGYVIYLAEKYAEKYGVSWRSYINVGFTGERGSSIHSVESYVPIQQNIGERIFNEYRSKIKENDDYITNKNLIKSMLHWAVKGEKGDPLHEAARDAPDWGEDKDPFPSGRLINDYYGHGDRISQLIDSLDYEDVIAEGIVRGEILKELQESSGKDEVYNTYGRPFEISKLIGEKFGGNGDQNGVGKAIEDGAGALNKGIDKISEDFARLMANTFSFATVYDIPVNANNPKDKCFEYGNAPNQPGPNDIGQEMPAYAFSVGFQAGIAIPGVLYSLITMITNGGKPSWDGITFYIPGTLNGKMSIDCYGRGATYTLRTKMWPGGGDRSQSLARDITGTGLTDAVVGIAKTLWNGFLSFTGTKRDDDVERDMWGGIGQALNGAAQSVSGGAPIDGILSLIPIPYSRMINYHNGFFNSFVVNEDSIVLPDNLKYRFVDRAQSRLAWMDGVDNGKYFLEGSGHKGSSNGETQFPGLYLKLAKPYHLEDETNVNLKTTQDGSEIKMDLKIAHKGYNEKNRYREDSSHGGQRKEGNRMRLIETIISPGASGDVIKKNEYYQDYETAQHNLKGETGVQPLGDVDGMKPGAICEFYKSKLAAKGLSQCNDGGNTVVPFSSDQPGIRNIPAGFDPLPVINLKKVIPPETPPGTKYCYSIYIERKDNDIKYLGARYYQNSSRTPNFNPNYFAAKDGKKGYLTKANCAVTGYKPSFQVRNGDLMVSGSINTETNRKGGPKDGSGATKVYGSWAEYAAIAGSDITKLASGARYRTGYEGSVNYDNIGSLTFSNSSAGFGNYTSMGGNFDGSDRVIGFFNERKKSAGSGGCSGGSVIDISACSSGEIRLPGGTVQIHGTIGQGKSLVFIVPSGTKIMVDGNIVTPSQYDSIYNISQVVFLPESGGYEFNIKSNVTRVDAWILNPAGLLNSCYYDGEAKDTPRSFIAQDVSVNASRGYGDHPCRINNLVINGVVSVRDAYLRRTGGVDQNFEGGDTHQSVSGENFIMRADNFVWSINQVTQDGSKFQVVETVDLPPRY